MTPIGSANDALSVTLPKAVSRSRRRRLPKPPKFSRSEKLRLFVVTVAVVDMIVNGRVFTAIGFPFAVGYALYASAIVRNAFGHHRVAYRQMNFALGLFVFGWALILAT